jgi:hypothetical protein
VMFIMLRTLWEGNALHLVFVNCIDYASLCTTFRTMLSTTPSFSE